ncbi:MAG: CvpA family protein [Alphaproteobacteria bacterium]
MSGWPINPFDTSVILIILLSGGLAFMRGFTREILSLLAWAGAAAATYALFGSVSPIGNAYISPGWLADAISALGIFVPALIILWLLSGSLSQRVKSSAIGALDRTLGFIFGLGRGAVMVSILFLGLGWLIPMEPDPPDWAGEARTLSLVRYGSELFLNLQPGDAASAAQKTLQTRALAPTSKHTPDSQTETGYKTNQRQSLEQLIEGQDASP